MSATATATATLSDRQRAFILAMLAEVLSAESNPAEAAETVLAANVAAGRFATRAQTSEMIDALIAKRDAARAARRSAVRPAAVAVAAGYYAVTHAGALRFYRVVVKESGKWAGRTFVNRYKSDDELRVTRTESDAVLALIAEDAEAAALAFVAYTECCTRCGRRLTDLETAKKNGGYGPECVKMVR